MPLTLPSQALTYTGTAGNDDLWGASDYPTLLIGLGGDDTFRASSPATAVVQFNSLSGQNTFDFTGWFRETDLLDDDYAVLDDVNTLNLVVTGPEGTDSVHRYYRYDRASTWSDHGIDALTFKDGTLYLGDTPHFVAEDSATDSLRYYLSALGRLPDAEGLNYWIDQRAAGMSVQQQVAGIVGSDEFRQHTAESNEVFLTRLYEGGLDRAADAGGFSYWLNQLNAGLAEDQVVNGFATSVEMYAHVAQIVQDGVDLI